MHRIVLLLAALLVHTSVADAQVAVGVRTSVGGGLGQVARPVYGGLAGVDAQVPVSRSWSVGMSFDRLLIERPEGPSGSETQLNLTANYAKQKKANHFSVALGIGMRRFRTQSSDPLLGAIEVRGINVLHARMEVAREIATNVRLGFTFDWTIGLYVSGRYDDPSAYTDEHDTAPPDINAGRIGGFSNMYTIGPRLSFVLD